MIMSKKITAVVLILALALIYATASSFADSGAVISISPVNTVSGEVVTVNVNVSGSNIGRAEVMLEYDTDYLSYVSGGQSSGDNGTVQLKDAGTGEDLVFTLEFKALKAGSSSLDIASAQVYDIDEQEMESNYQSADVEIAEVPQDDSNNGDSNDGSSDGQEQADSSDDQSDDPADDTSKKDSGKEKSDLMLYIGIGLIVIGAIGLTIYFVSRRKHR